MSPPRIERKIARPPGSPSGFPSSRQRSTTAFLRSTCANTNAALERTPPWLQGEAASNHSTADEIWKLVRAPAQMLNYERHGYHLLPGIGLK